MTAPMDLSEDESVLWEDDVHARPVLQKLSDARAALKRLNEDWAIAVYETQVAVGALKYVKGQFHELRLQRINPAKHAVDEQGAISLIESALSEIRSAALATPAPVAVPHSDDCDVNDPMIRTKPCNCGVAAPDPVKAAYAECIAIVEKWRDNNLGGWTSAAIVSLIETAALRAGVKP